MIFEDPLHQAGNRADHRRAGLCEGALSAGRAASIWNRLREITILLEDHPYIGHATDRPRIRRCVTTPYPYLIDYRVSASEIVILRFRHAARRPT